MKMSWIKNLFVKKKTLDEVRAWVAESQDPEVDQIRVILVKIDACMLDRSEKQAEIDQLKSIKLSLEEQHSKIVQEKEDFLATPDYKALKEQLAGLVSQRKA